MLTGPRLDKISSVRNCGMVMFSSTAAIECAEIATNKRDAVSNASVIASDESSTGTALSIGIVVPLSETDYPSPGRQHTAQEMVRKIGQIFNVSYIHYCLYAL